MHLLVGFTTPLGLSEKSASALRPVFRLRDFFKPLMVSLKPSLSSLTSPGEMLPSGDCVRANI